MALIRATIALASRPSISESTDTFMPLEWTFTDPTHAVGLTQALRPVSACAWIGRNAVTAAIAVRVIKMRRMTNLHPLPRAVLAGDWDQTSGTRWESNR